jgi:pyruvate,water dikinase
VKEIYWLDRIKPSENIVIGKRAEILSQLAQQGYSVFFGFAIEASSLKDFFESTDDSDSLLTDLCTSSWHLDIDNYKALQRVAQQSRQIILSTSLSSELVETIYTEAQKFNCSAVILHPVVVSPSIERANYESLLRSPVCWLSAEHLSVALKEIWIEIFTAKSLFYARKANIDLQQIQLSILVQPIINAIASGKAIIERESIIITATYGLEDSLILGEVLPDEYRIQLDTGIVEAQNIGLKTRAYRLKERLNSTDLETDCLETYLLSEREQESLTIDSIYLAKLTNLLIKLPRKADEVVTVSWTLVTTEASLYEAEFYLTEYTTKTDYTKVVAPNNHLPRGSSVENSQPLLTGLAASPGYAIAPAAIIATSEFDSQHISEGIIIVAKNINSNFLPFLKNAAGLIVEEGGLTSHGAILAREMNIPAIVAAKNALSAIASGESILLNGDTGEVYRFHGELGVGNREQVHSNDVSSELSSALERVESRESGKGKALPCPYGNRELEVGEDRESFNYPIATQLMVNISQSSSIDRAKALKIDGVGLLRSELMLLDILSEQPFERWLETSNRQKFIDRWTESLAKFAIAFAPRPIFYRSLDGYSQPIPNSNSDRQIDALSTRRGTYNYLLDPSLFDLELEVLLRLQERGYSNINLILPFVRSVEEFIFCRDRIEKIGLTKQPSFQIWIMAEVPSVIFLLPEYIKAGVGGIAIGTNDLTQLLLGIDRDDAHLNHQFQTTHPAILAALKKLIKTAKKQNIPCSICGRSTIDNPELIEHLITWGITTISTELEAIPTTYQAIARIEKRLLLEIARNRD